MEKRNIYKTDDFLIIGSFLMLIPAVYFCWPWLSRFSSTEDLMAWLISAPQVLGSQLPLVGTYLCGSILAQIIGRILRHREKQTLEILDTVMYLGKVTVSQVATNLNLSEVKVRKLTQRLSRVRSIHIKLENDVISYEMKPVQNMSGFSTATPDFQPPPESQSPPQAEEEAQFTQTTREEVIVNNLTPELQEFIKNNKMDLFGKIELIKRIVESKGKITVEELKQTPTSKKEPSKKMKALMIILFISFMTPLWPIPFIVIIYLIVKQFKLKDFKFPTQENLGNTEEQGE
ncbi:MAG: hypothetical protein PQJ59_02555 [Spirochaetales bacterium]|nr:hypothetical protein [Spirochaetales bacterium]